MVAEALSNLIALCDFLLGDKITLYVISYICYMLCCRHVISLQVITWLCYIFTSYYMLMLYYDNMLLHAYITYYISRLFVCL